MTRTLKNNLKVEQSVQELNIDNVQLEVKKSYSSPASLKNKLRNSREQPQEIKIKVEKTLIIWQEIEKREL